MTIVWSPEAADDLDTAVAYLMERNVDAARRLSAAVFALVDVLAIEPMDGPAQVLANGEEVRSWPLPPFRVYYRRSGEDILVVRVYHQRRAPLAR